MLDTDLLISLGVTSIIESIKRPEKREKLKKILLKVYKKIGEAYAGDPDFA